MAHGLSLLLPQQGDQCCYEGYISVKEGTEYHLRLTLPHSDMSLKDARLECDWKLSNLLRSHKELVHKRLSTSSNVDQFVLELKAIIKRLGVGPFPNGGQQTIPGNACTKLMADLDQLGWNRVVHISPDLLTLKVTAYDRAAREHIIILTLSHQFPSRPPFVTADVPLPFTLHWNYPSPECSLVSLVQQFEAWLVQFGPLWASLDEIDEKCWVLEPEKPTRACTYRRIMIGENLSAHVVLKPLAPTSTPQMTFLGADSDVARLELAWNLHVDKWNYEESLLWNLENTLSLSFPSRPKDAASLEDSGCGICYDYRLDGDMPSVVCGNTPCAQVFHSQCIYDWLRSLPTVTRSFNKVTGECPYCGQLIRIQHNSITQT